MAPELVAGGSYGGLIREKPHCAAGGDCGVGRKHTGRRDDSHDRHRGGGVTRGPSDRETKNVTLRHPLQLL